MADTLTRVQKLVVETLGVDEGKVVSQARFKEELGADSLDLVEMIMAFEEEFGGESPDEKAQKITTVGEAVSFIDTYMGK